MLNRSSKNPIIKPSDVKPSFEGYNVIGALNPAAALYNDEFILLVRVAENCIPKEGKIRVPIYRFVEGDGIPDILEFDESDPDVKLKDTRGVVYKGVDYLTTLSHIRIARSKDGVNFKVDEKPFIYPCREEEKYGVEDARVTFIDGKYYINYTIVSGDSWSTALSVTEDFKTHKRLGIIFPPENKDVAIFPEKINGMYTALHRPNNSGFGKASIWYAESPDLIHWGGHRCIARPRNTSFESMKIGGGSYPIKTPKGWLCIYHSKGDNSRYTLFAMLLDLKKPWIVTDRLDKPLLVPESDYEINGFFGNVVFSNGIVEKNDELYIYYGASDDTSCVATTTVDYILSLFDLS
ncbi:MAG TPA: glycoside hydrolase family 130 protein [Victivallales bacterium]|nr:glycoside hydrolase family 130 protein [Victivallales bacterium]